MMCYAWGGQGFGAGPGGEVWLFPGSARAVLYAVRTRPVAWPWGQGQCASGQRKLIVSTKCEIDSWHKNKDIEILLQLVQMAGSGKRKAPATLTKVLFIVCHQEFFSFSKYSFKLDFSQRRKLTTGHILFTWAV